MIPAYAPGQKKVKKEEHPKAAVTARANPRFWFWEVSFCCMAGRTNFRQLQL